jgi:hypothetical protein
MQRKNLRFTLNSTQAEPHIEAFGIEWREYALNGEEVRRMVRYFF